MIEKKNKENEGYKESRNQVQNRSKERKKSEGAGVICRIAVGWVLCFLCCLFCSVETRAGEQLAFDEQGNLMMTTHDRIATSSRTYKTVGWTIKRYDMPIGAEGNDSVVVMLEDNGAPQPDPDNAGYQYCYFWCDAEMIFNRIGAVSPEWQWELYLNGGTVYLDAVMVVCHSGTAQGGLVNQGDASWGQVYYTFEGIAGAENWTNPDVLRSHFDKRVYFGGNAALLNRKCTYQIHYYECFDDLLELWPLNRYGWDRSGELDRGEQLTVQPEDYSGYGFIYVSAYVEKFYEDGRSEAGWVDVWPIQIQSDTDGLNDIRVGLYYKRRNYVNYLYDKFHMDGDSILVEGDVSIGAGSRQNETFDVSKGVPTGEELYIEGKQNSFGYQVKYANYYGTKTRKVTMVSHYECQWTDSSGTLQTAWWDVPETYYVDRPYSYWCIDAIEVYTLKGMIVYNYAFDEENVRIEDLYHPQIMIEQKEEHIKNEETKQYLIYGGVLIGEGRWPDFPYGIRQTEADLLTEPWRVSNDSFSVDQEVFLDGNEAEACSTNPKLGSDSGKTEIYAEKLKIPVNKKNGRAYESRAEIEYVKFSDGSAIVKEFGPVNPVTLHTPVVCRGYVTDERIYNQLWKPNQERKTWILGRNFYMQMSAFGEHLNQLGYGVQDYERYVGKYQVKFPFPVYYEGTYYEPETWLDYEEKIWEGNGAGMCFYLPTGVPEGDYTVLVRSLAYNSDSEHEGKIEENGNYMLENYGAFEEIPVTVCGRLYGMRITDIERESWKPVFWNQQGDWIGHKYTIGLHNLNGELVRRNPLAVFPILAGGNPLDAEYEGEPLGSAFSYVIESIGDYAEEDGVLVEPEFYVTDRDGGNRRKVDLYHFYEQDGVTEWKSIKESEESGIQNMGKNQRSNTGSCEQNVKDSLTAVNSVQEWSGRFVVPDDIFAVPAGTDIEEYVRTNGSIEETDEIFIRKGYLLVQFDIYTVKAGEKHLSYINEENAKDGFANMWKIEGFTNPRLRKDKSEFTLEYGDVFLYDLEKHQKDSHEIMGTH